MTVSYLEGRCEACNALALVDAEAKTERRLGESQRRQLGGHRLGILAGEPESEVTS